MRKKVKTLIAVFMVLLSLAVLSFAMVACDGKGGSASGGEYQPPENVQVTVKKLVADYIKEKNIENAIQNEHEECLKGIVSKAVNELDAETFKTFVKGSTVVTVYKYKNDNGRTQLGSMTFAISSYVQYCLGRDIEDILLEEIGESGNTNVPVSLKESYAQKFDSAFDNVLGKINAEQYTSLHTNEYVTDCECPSSIKQEVLHYIESRDSLKLTEPVVFSSPRKDGSAILVGVDSTGNIWEYHFFVEEGNSLTPVAFYDRVSSGESTMVSRKIDANSAYTAPDIQLPPPPEMVSVSEIYDKVFEGFQFADLGSLMNDLAERELSGWTAKVLFAEFDNAKTEIALYAEGVDSRNRTSLLKLSFKSESGDIVKDIQEYQEFKDMTDEKIKQYVLDGLNITKTEVEKDSAEQTQLESNLTQERQRLEGLGNDIQDNSKLKLLNREIMINATATELANVNHYGEKLLEDEKNIEVLRTYLGAWGGRNIDSQHRFNTGYLQGTNASVIYVKDGKIYIYKTDIQVPHYIDSTNETLYQSILDGKLVKLNEQTTEINNTIIFDESYKSATKQTIRFENSLELYCERKSIWT